jgi:NitT/TauT family transport system permease protein
MNLWNQFLHTLFVSFGRLPTELAEFSQEPEHGISLRQFFSLDVIAPAMVGILFLAVWEIGVRISGIEPYLLPGPILVMQTLIKDWGDLFPKLVITTQTTLQAFAAAVVSGVLISIVFTQSRWIERSFFPYAVVMQTVPIIAIAPLLLIWTKFNTPLTMLLCAWIVAFFPIVSNTTLGLKSADHNLVNLFQLYQASWWQTLLYLRLPNAMPYFLGGLKISGGLSVIGAVVAEFTAGSGGTKAGIAYEILISQIELKIPRMFAALLLTSALGIAIFVVLTIFSDWMLRHWHESAVRREN